MVKCVTQICPADRRHSSHQEAVLIPAGCQKGIHRATETSPSHWAGLGPFVKWQWPQVGCGPFYATMMSAGDMKAPRSPGDRLGVYLHGKAEVIAAQSLGSLPRTDRLTSNVTTTVLKAGPLRHVPLICLEAVGPSRAEVSQRVEKVRLGRVVVVAGGRPQDHSLQSSDASMPLPPTGLAGAGRAAEGWLPLFLSLLLLLQLSASHVFPRIEDLQI